MVLEDYSITQKLLESQSSIIYRATRQSDNLPVIIKMLKRSLFSTEKYNIFSMEFELASQLPKEFFIQYYELIKLEDSLALVLEDMGGESLSIYLRQVG